jgi:hypothetical protein
MDAFLPETHSVRLSLYDETIILLREGTMIQTEVKALLAGELPLARTNVTLLITVRVREYYPLIITIRANAERF